MFQTTNQIHVITCIWSEFELFKCDHMCVNMLPIKYDIQL